MIEQVKLMPREIREADFPIARFLTEQEQEKYKIVCEEFSEKAKSSLDIQRQGSNLWKIILLNKN